MHDASRHTPAGAPLGEAALIRAIGALALTAAVVNVIVGGGIFRMPAALAAQMGAAAPLALLAGAVAIVPVALCFAAVGSRVQVTGGAYSYLAAAFGPFPGFVGGALMWIGNLTASAGVAAALSLQAAALLPALAPPGPRALLLLGVYGALFALNAFGVRLGSRAIMALAALKLAPLFALVALGLWWVDWAQVSLAPADVPSWRALGAAMVLVMFAYAGMEIALVPSGEVRDPARNVPRATLAAIVLVVLLYLGLQIVGQGLLGAGLAASGVPVADAAGALWGAAGRSLLLVTACISMAGFLMGNLLGSSRLVYALGRDGYLPRAFGAVGARHRVPLLALALHATLACALAIGGSFEALALVAGGAICLVYLLVSLAAWRAQRRDLRERGTPFVLPGGAAIPLLSASAMLAILATLSAQEWRAIGIALALLVAVYAGLVRWRARRPAAS
ncbi:APC family permease [Vulcaniibacterium gelatinicum]|uniref:APC family permease n=1 Tax=Vulcaniibacterium gelatinicum TaxID=2598725 RepID=UPI0015F2EA4F|nr:APC family permease [Vulcaniibacterium gelatinicum]